MKKVNKAEILSTVYKNWVDDFDLQGANHQTYSSKNPNYISLVMNLFRCQNGLCAYTEMRLCIEELYESNLWVEGVYPNRDAKFFGQLDHFDPRLKNAKGWSWENSFMINSDINNDKSRYIPSNLLKPDSNDYNPNLFLEFSTSTNIYIANLGLSEEQQAEIKRTIELLGLNHPTVRNAREKILAKSRKSVELGICNLDDIEIDEFPTAIEKLKEELRARGA